MFKSSAGQLQYTQQEPGRSTDVSGENEGRVTCDVRRWCFNVLALFQMLPTVRTGTNRGVRIRTYVHTITHTERRDLRLRSLHVLEH